MERETRNYQADIDWENRILCDDGHCIGVIGPDGCCKECGRRYEGDLPAALQKNEAAAETVPPETVTSLEESAETEPLEKESVQASDEEWENRRLCIDGNCIGVIGADGKCKECGRPYES
ncbi:MAG: hypothetical protein GY697_26340 [Desulfobacterales bacterium]|nr:hypothetical protein [Desulfobacterales bacterium]